MTCFAVACATAQDLEQLGAQRSGDGGAGSGSSDSSGASDGVDDNTVVKGDGSETSGGGSGGAGGADDATAVGGTSSDDTGGASSSATGDSGGSASTGGIGGTESVGGGGGATEEGGSGGEPDMSSGGTPSVGGDTATDAGGADAAGGAGGTAAGGAGGDNTAGGAGGSATSSDECPDDADKTEPGVCGCGTPDTDSDSDDTPDCDDECPDDPDKSEAGDCGCGLAEDPACATLVGTIAHRYSFEGTGTTAEDLAGSADGTLVGAVQSGGKVNFVGGTTDDYVDLPNGIISSLTDATIETWVTWTGTSAWQRIFDFGDSDAGEDAQGDGLSYLFLTPMSVNTSGVMRAALTLDGPTNEAMVDATAKLSTGEHHLAVVIDGGNSMALYLDGTLVDTVAATDPLASLNDVNNWLGRSQYLADQSFAGSINEFRIYDSVLTSDEIQSSFDFGPDSEFLTP